MNIEAPQKERTYDLGKPLELRQLGENDFQNSIYRRGKALYESGRTPVQDAVFVQIWTLEPGEGREVACISRDVVWDGETAIEEYGEALVRAIAGRDVDRGQWYGDYEYTAFIEGDLDPEQLVRNLIYSPARMYKEYLENLTLAEAAQRDEADFERDFLYANYAKGKKFVDISAGKVSGQQSAVQEGQGRGFVFGWEKMANGKLRAIKPGETGSQTLDELVYHPLAGSDMRDDLLEKQEYFSGYSGKRRTAIKFTLHPTRTCCIYATAAQSYSVANFNKTFEFENGPKILQAETKNLFPNLFIETPKCANCNQPNVNGNDHVCQKEENKV